MESALANATPGSASTADALPGVVALHWMFSSLHDMLPVCDSFPQPVRFLLLFGLHQPKAG